MHFATKVAAAAFASLLVAAPVLALAADPTGTWQADDGKSRYKITYCQGGDALCGELIWLRDKDDKNWGYLNQTVVQGTQAEANTWTGTVSLDGGTYSGTLTMTGADSMKVKGCQGVFCNTINLSRV
jgi:uncharacterized protein (DUF2147 family)